MRLSPVTLFCSSALLLAGLSACIPTKPPSNTDESPTDSSPGVFTDEDGDGYDAIADGGTDCDDNNPNVNPGAPEQCDGVDNNCDGTLDDGTASDWYVDSDGDGYGTGDAVPSCEALGRGWAAVDGDCNDADAAVHPDAEVECSDQDNNCDGLADDVDADGDGYSGCTECDDTRADVFPGAAELCDTVDQDCDGTVDEDATDGPTWSRDADGDGFGDPTDTLSACEAPSGYVADATDCDDSDGATWPGATEVCDGLDNDCDGEVDGEAATGTRTWYTDADGDGYGDPAGATAESCEPLSGMSADPRDCDDASSATYPGAPDLPYDGVDADCAGDSDYDADGDTYDAEAYGGSDCDDADGAIFPGASDTPYDGVDADCAGDSDYDADGDSYDAKAYGGADCDDSAAGTHPGATDVWYDGVDQDCDGASDYDADADGYDAKAYGGADCDDTRSTVSPAATEVFYDGVDQDCDGASDYDADADGYDATAFGGADCDDTVATVSPAATERYYDGLDQDCDGASDYDADADGYDAEAYGGQDCDDVVASVSPAATERYYDGVDQDCDDASDYDADRDGYDASAYGGADCDDTSAVISPTATEVYYDGVDQDCDAASDYDADGDGYDAEAYGGADCDDSTVSISPVAVEIAGDGVDQNCEGNDGPTLSLSASAGTVVALEGYTATSGAAVTVSNGGEGTLSWTASADAAWVDLGASSGSGGDILTLDADAAGLSAGTYTATITLEEASAGLDSASYTLTLEVADTWSGTATTTITRDDNGDIAAMQDPTGATFALTRDGNGRLVDMTASNGDYTSLSYTALGKPDTYENAEGVLDLDWTVDGGVDKVTWPDGAVTDYTWDSSGRVSTVTLPSGATLTYSYSTSNTVQPDRVTSSVSGAVNLTYDSDGRVLTRSTTRSKTTYTYDATFGKVASITHADTAGTTRLKLVYTYNSRGLVATRAVTDSSGTVTQSYTYDGNGRLESVSGTDGYSLSYTYDDAGNRLTMTEDGALTTYLYDSDDRLLQAGEEVFEYDEAGRMVRRVSPDADITYTWDAFGKLLSVSDGSDTVEYGYAGNGTRVRRTYGSETTTYYHDLSTLVPHLLEADIDSGSSSSTARFVWAGGLAWAGLDSTGYATLTDHTGTVQGLASSVMVQRLEFGAFGEPQSAPSLADPFLWMGFAGEETDPVTGLVYLRDRYYDPVLGRFLSPDSSTPGPERTEDWNSYAYCENDPINFIDPTGDIDWGATIGGVLAVAGGIAGMVALATMTPVVATTGAAVLTAYIAISSVSSIAFGLGQTLAGITAPEGTKVEMPGGILETLGKIITSNMTDPNNQAAVEAAIKAVDMLLPGPDKLMKVGGVWDKALEAIAAIDKMAKSKDMGDMWVKLHEVLERLKQTDPDAWEKLVGWMFDKDKPIPSDDPRGGIYLNASATVLADLSQIDGAAVDRSTGQLVLYGKDGGITVDGLDGDMLFTALQWIYDGIQSGSFEAPGVTIENDLIPPESPTPPTSTETWHGVGYFGGIEYTEAGFAAFEADRMLKSLNLSVDSDDPSISYDWIADYVSDFECGIDAYERYYDGTSPAGWVRYWLEPDQMVLTLDGSRDALEFTVATMQAQYEDQTDTTQRWPAYDDWTTMLTTNYDDIAVHVESWEDLRTAAKFVAVAYWLYEEDLVKTLDWDWINAYEEEVYDTPWWTLEGSVSFEMEYGGTTLTQIHKGGASLTTFGHGYQTDSTGDVQATWDEVLAARTSDTDTSWSFTDPDGETGTAVALPLARVPMPGGAHVTRADLYAPAVGRIPLELRRSWSSIHAQAGRGQGLGDGWFITPWSLDPSSLTTAPGSFDVPYTLEVFDHLRGEQLHYEYGGWDGASAYFYAEGRNDALILDATGTYTWAQPDNTEATFDSDGQLLGVTDLSGNGATYTWSGEQLTQIDHTSGHSITLTWSAAGQLTDAATDTGWSVSYGYDSSGRLDELEDIGGQTWLLGYSSAGLLDSLVSPDGDEIWSVEYDDYGRMLSETLFGNTTEYAPSMQDGTLTTEDGAGVGVSAQYDEEGRLEALTDGEGGVWSISWDSEGRLSELMDAVGNTSTVEYNSYGMPWKVTDGEGQVTAMYWTWTYGEPVVYAYQQPDGQAWYLDRDSDGNVQNVYSATLTVAADGSLSGVSLGSVQQSMTYTTDGLLSAWSKGSLKATYTYTSSGQLSTVKDLMGATRTYTYDSAGRLSQVTTATGVSFGTTWDSTHPLLPAAMTAGSTTVATFEYDALGRLVSATDGGGYQSLWTYGDDGLLASSEDPEGGWLVVDRDAAGRITGVEGSWGMARSWTYDDAGRVVSASREVALP